MAAKGGLVGRRHRRRLRRAAGGHRRRSAPGQTGTPTARCSTSCCAAWGAFGQDAPAAMRVFSGRGQPTCEQLIDRYHIACQPVRDVLVDYLRERQPSVDFSSLQRLAYLLGKLFWADLEAHHPGIGSLKLPRDVAAAWKQRVMTRTRTTATADGEAVPTVTARLDGRSVLTAVRAFYLDIAEWADDDPPGGCRTRCAARSAPATPPTRRTGPGASPGWTSGPGNGCRCCPPWPPGPTPSGTAAAERLQAARHTAAGSLFTAGGPDAAPGGDEDPDHRPDLGRGPRQPASAATSPSKNTAGSGPGRWSRCCGTPASGSRN